MALTTEQKNKAKTEAIEFLEYSIYSLALVLGVDPETLDENFENPETQESDLARWKSFNSLIAQLAAYAALTDS
ncbi:MAG: hypothetical protein EBY38_06225 [Flavobacteriaceae bacterium]|jgi:hypothetical protein|nr:hypothetical protein [Flavobacteriaceae bacterium]